MAQNYGMYIKDTGLDKVGGSAVYTPVNSGDWIPLYGFQLTSEYNTQTTDNDAFLNDPLDSSKVKFQSNETTAILAPRLTIRGLVEGGPADTITHIIDLGRSKGIKYIYGGLGTIWSSPDSFVTTGDDLSNQRAVAVIVKNITLTETIADDDGHIGVTIQLEQVN
jgi:hypothetical protein